MKNAVIWNNFTESENEMAGVIPYDKMEAFFKENLK